MVFDCGGQIWEDALSFTGSSFGYGVGKMLVAAIHRCGCRLLKVFGCLKLSAILPAIISSEWWLDLCVLVLSL
ncbi:Hypothetical predicted protein, partial [Olea europaea subsp. europaea]